MTSAWGGGAASAAAGVRSVARLIRRSPVLLLPAAASVLAVSVLMAYLSSGRNGAVSKMLLGAVIGAAAPSAFILLLRREFGRAIDAQTAIQTFGYCFLTYLVASLAAGGLYEAFAAQVLARRPSDGSIWFALLAGVFELTRMLLYATLAIAGIGLAMLPSRKGVLDALHGGAAAAAARPGFVAALAGLVLLAVHAISWSRGELTEAAKIRELDGIPTLLRLLSPAVKELVSEAVLYGAPLCAVRAGAFEDGR